MVHMSLATMLPRWVPWLGSGAGERRNLILRKEGVGKKRPVSSVSILGYKPVIEIKFPTEMFVPRWRLNWVADTFRHPGPANRRRNSQSLGTQLKRHGLRRPTTVFKWNGRPDLLARAQKRAQSKAAFKKLKTAYRKAHKLMKTSPIPGHRRPGKGLKKALGIS